MHFDHNFRRYFFFRILGFLRECSCFFSLKERQIIPRQFGTRFHRGAFVRLFRLQRGLRVCLAFSRSQCFHLQICSDSLKKRATREPRLLLGKRRKRLIFRRRQSSTAEPSALEVCSARRCAAIPQARQRGCRYLNPLLLFGEGKLAQKRST